MKQQIPVLNSRQKELLITLLTINNPISYKELSDMFKVSTRTIQREMKALQSILDMYELKIGKKFGNGLLIKGSDEGKKTLLEQIQQTKTLSAYSPEERQDSMTYDLLISKEPIKQFVFSQKFGVADATVSSDLDKVALWLEEGGIKLIRTPGLGVYIEGQETQRRTMLSRLLHKDVTFEKWLELFHKKAETEESFTEGRAGTVIRNRLLKFVQAPQIFEVERIVHQVLQEQTEIELTDRNYVNLIVHLMLAVERIKSGGIIETTTLPQDYEFDPSIYLLAQKIVERLETALAISIPKIEINYIVLHLSGAKLSNEKEIVNYEMEEFTWIELTQSFIRAVETYLQESFADDELLFEGLVSHFAPAFTRLQFGLQIHNPMLEKIKETYPDIYTACQEACVLLETKTGCRIPVDEIGYLAMHVGAAVIRKQDALKNQYKAIVICASGLGTSTYLASSLRTKMPQLKVEATVAMHQLENWLKEEAEIDILISTIHLPAVKNKNVVVVSPFLNKDDLSRIQTALSRVHHSRQEKKNNEESQGGSMSILSLAKYGEGMMQILQNLTILPDIDAQSPVWLPNLLKQLERHEKITDFSQLTADLEKREKQGTFIIDNLAMIHTKTAGVSQLLVAVLRTRKPILWFSNDEEERQSVQSVLLLATPYDAPKEHIEMISEISSMLIEESFLAVLTESAPDVVKNTLEHILAKAYEARAKRSIKGQ